MKKLAMAIAGGILAGGLAQAENLEGVDEMICAPAQVSICVEDDTCYGSTAAELGVPDFVVIDTKMNTISTTKASNQNRSTEFTSVVKSDGLVYLQGIEAGRAFSFVIDEATGRMTAAVSRDGIAVNIFGACTDTNI